MKPVNNVFRTACIFCFKALLVFVILIVVADYYATNWNTLYIKHVVLSNSSRGNLEYHLHEYPRPPEGYLVWSNSCHMPDVDPFTKDAMKLFTKKSYSLCSTVEPVTQLLFDMNSQTFSLRIENNVTNSLLENNDSISCCYQSVLRSGTGERVDKDFKLKACEPFSNGDVLPLDVDGLIVNCTSAQNRTLIQKDAYFVVREKPEVRYKLNSYKNRSELQRPVSVMMLGIDTMSRFNLRRVMPETTKKLTSGNWFELSGYNKIDDNTFPNLMAILSGYSYNTAKSKCDLKVPGGLDSCNLIWETFRNNGYVTAYAEDETWMSTFDYVRKGFIKPPVDYYHRPFMLGIEKNLHIKKMSGMTFCIGRRHAAEYIYDFAMQFGTRFKSQPYFGLFWTNTFTHNSFSDASAMDVRIANYIDEMQERGILDDSIVVLFSDHGSRFGGIRSLKQGFLDERLPFFFIWLPPWFRAQNPMFVHALKMNRYRLTSPYDIHMTLKQLLELSGRTGKQPNAYDCPHCQSVFLPVPEERHCKDAGIDDHWCTCIPYENVATDNKVVVRATKAVLDSLNLYLKYNNITPPCSSLRMNKIQEAQRQIDLSFKKHSTNSSDTNVYRIRFSVRQNANFEASVAHSESQKTYEVIDSVSRLDAYANQSECISNKEAKKYCICISKVT